jgi:hypothetical protein
MMNVSHTSSSGITQEQIDKIEASVEEAKKIILNMARQAILENTLPPTSSEGKRPRF